MAKWLENPRIDPPKFSLKSKYYCSTGKQTKNGRGEKEREGEKKQNETKKK